MGGILVGGDSFPSSRGIALREVDASGRRVGSGSSSAPNHPRVSPTILLKPGRGGQSASASRDISRRQWSLSVRVPMLPSTKWI